MLARAIAGEAVPVTFTAQVVPVCRGILSTLYGTLRDGIHLADVQAAYQDLQEHLKDAKDY